MRIGIDIRCLMEKQYSGISQYTYNLLKHLFKNDSENQYVLFYNSAQATNVPRFDYPNVIVKDYKFPNKLFNLSVKFLKVAAIDKLIGGVDVFILPNFLFVNLSQNCKKIVIVHDLSFEIFPQFFTYKKRLWHHLINPKQLCRQADKVVAISNNTKNDLVDLYNVPDQKIIKIYPGIDDMFFQPITQEKITEVKLKYNLPENYIFYLGNLEPRKNVVSLLKAFEKIADKDIYLVIAGGQAWKYKNIFKIREHLENKKRIKFLGYIDDADKPAVYHLAKIFVYPSIYEGFGLPPLEAMACGTPTIASFSSSLPEAIGSAGLLIDPNNINDLTLAIDQILGNKELADNLSRAGKSQASKFNWDDVSQQFLQLINTFK